MFHCFNHDGKHFKTFTLIFIQRVFLAIAAQTDALLQMIHIQEMFFPIGINHLQKNNPFKITHAFNTDPLFLLLIGALGNLLQLIDKPVVVQILFVRFIPFWCNTNDAL